MHRNCKSTNVLRRLKTCATDVEILTIYPTVFAANRIVYRQLVVTIRSNVAVKASHIGKCSAGMRKL